MKKFMLLMGVAAVAGSVTALNEVVTPSEAASGRGHVISIPDGNIQKKPGEIGGGVMTMPDKKGEAPLIKEKKSHGRGKKKDSPPKPKVEKPVTR